MGHRENKVENHLDKQFENRGGLTRKWVSPGRVGVPDRICILDGVVWFVEIKTHDGKLSTPQQRELNRLLKAGANCAVVYGCKDVDALMKEIDDDSTETSVQP